MKKLLIAAIVLFPAASFAEGFWVCTDKNTKTTQYTYNPVATDDVTCVPMDNKRVTFSKMEENKETKKAGKVKKTVSDKPKKSSHVKGKSKGKGKKADLKKKASSAAKKASASGKKSGGKSSGKKKKKK